MPLCMRYTCLHFAFICFDLEVDGVFFYFPLFAHWLERACKCSLWLLCIATANYVCSSISNIFLSLSHFAFQHSLRSSSFDNRAISVCFLFTAMTSQPKLIVRSHFGTAELIAQQIDIRLVKQILCLASSSGTENINSNDANTTPSQQPSSFDHRRTP